MALPSATVIDSHASRSYTPSAPAAASMRSAESSDVRSPDPPATLSVRHLARPDHRRERALLAQPAVHREPVEPVGVGMAPGVVGIDRARQLGGQAGQPLGVGALGVGHPREVVAAPGCRRRGRSSSRRARRRSSAAASGRARRRARGRPCGTRRPARRRAARRGRRGASPARPARPAGRGPRARRTSHAGPVQIPRGRQAGEARADDDDVGHRAPQARRACARSRRRGSARPRPPTPGPAPSARAASGS